MLKEYEKADRRKHLAAALRIRGYLLKKSKKIMRTYRRRFFIIIEDNLVYCTDETLDEIRKQFHLSDIKQLKAENECEFSFFHKTRQFIFKAKDPQQRNDWLSSLNIIISYIEVSQREDSFCQEGPVCKILKIRSAETTFETQVRTTFYSLGLKRLGREFHEDYIKCRVAAHLYTKGCMFVVSCKSLMKEITDEIILSKEYIDPYQLDTIYLFDIRLKSLTQLIPCEDIKEVVLTGRSLRINSTLTNLEHQDSRFTQQFVSKVKASVSIAAQYHNKDNIALKQNVDMLVSLFSKKEDRLQKQHIQMKLEDEYINLLMGFDKTYKRVYSRFQLLINSMISLIVNTLEAISVKKEDLKDLSVTYSMFYYEKIHKLFKSFWNDNFDTISMEELIALTDLSHNYYLTVRQYMDDETNIVTGVRVLRDIFLKKMLSDVQISLKKEFANSEVFSLTVVHTTNLPFQFIRIVTDKAELISKYCNRDEFIFQSQKLFLEAAVFILINQLQTKIVLYNYRERMLVALCNDTWIYGKELGYVFPKLDLTEVDNILSKFHKSLTKRLYNYIYPQKAVEFLKIDVEQYHATINRAVLTLAEMHPSSLKQIGDRVGQNFCSLYFRSLVNASDKSVIFKNVTAQMIQKIKDDQILVGDVFGSEVQAKVTPLLKCLILLLNQEDEDILKQCYIDLKFCITPEDFRHNDVKSLLLLKYSFEEVEKKLNMFEEIDASDEDTFDVQPSKSLYLKPVRSSYHKTQAQLLINNDIDLEGYLQKKLEGRNLKGYAHEYFRLNSQCLLWYTNPNSQDLVGRIFLTDIKQVYLHPKHASKFFIEMKNGTRQKLKTSSGDVALKWVQKLNPSTCQPKLAKTPSSRKFSQEQLFTNFFECSSANKISDRPSMLSNYRNHQPSKLISSDSSSTSPIRLRKEELKTTTKFSIVKFFGCSSLQ